MFRFSRFSCLVVLLAGISPPLKAEENPGHRFYAADSSKKTLARVKESGEIEWKYAVGPLHDLHALPNGNLLLQTSWTRIVELNPKTQKVVWQYDAKSNGNQNRKVEVHAFERLPNGRTMIAESGTSRILEVDSQGKIQHQIALKVKQPQPHHDTRLVRKLENGNYLVCHENEGAVREYNRKGEVVWDYAVPLFGKPRKPGHGPEAFGNQCFSALRLKNGNTLIGTGNGHGVIEVTPKKSIVWSVHQEELPNIKLAWVTTLQVLENGNIIIGNCHAGPDQPQLVEITREKKVVWIYKNFQDFGNSLTNSVILSAGEKK